MVLDGPLQGMLYGLKCRQDTFSTTHSRAYQEDVSVQNWETPSPVRARRGSGSCWRPAYRRRCSRRRLARRGERERPGAVRDRHRWRGRAPAAPTTPAAGWGRTHSDAIGAATASAATFDRDTRANGCTHGAPADRVADGAGSRSEARARAAEARGRATAEHRCWRRGRHRYQPAAAGDGWPWCGRDDRGWRVRPALSQARGLASSALSLCALLSLAQGSALRRPHCEGPEKLGAFVVPLRLPFASRRVETGPPPRASASARARGG